MTLHYNNNSEFWKKIYNNIPGGLEDPNALDTEEDEGSEGAVNTPNEPNTNPNSTTGNAESSTRKKKSSLSKLRQDTSLETLREGSRLFFYDSESYERCTVTSINEQTGMITMKSDINPRVTYVRNFDSFTRVFAEMNGCTVPTTVQELKSLVYGKIILPTARVTELPDKGFLYAMGKDSKVIEAAATYEINGNTVKINDKVVSYEEFVEEVLKVGATEIAKDDSDKGLLEGFYDKPGDPDQQMHIDWTSIAGAATQFTEVFKAMKEAWGVRSKIGGLKLAAKLPLIGIEGKKKLESLENEQVNKFKGAFFDDLPAQDIRPALEKHLGRSSLLFSKYDKEFLKRAAFLAFLEKSFGVPALNNEQDYWIKKLGMGDMITPVNIDRENFGDAFINGLKKKYPNSKFVTQVESAINSGKEKGKQKLRLNLSSPAGWIMLLETLGINEPIDNWKKESPPPVPLTINQVQLMDIGSLTARMKDRTLSNQILADVREFFEVNFAVSDLGISHEQKFNIVFLFILASGNNDTFLSGKNMEEAGELAKKFNMPLLFMVKNKYRKDFRKLITETFPNKFGVRSMKDAYDILLGKDREQRLINRPAGLSKEDNSILDSYLGVVNSIYSEDRLEVPAVRSKVRETLTPALANAKYLEAVLKGSDTSNDRLVTGDSLEKYFTDNVFPILDAIQADGGKMGNMGRVRDNFSVNLLMALKKIKRKESILDSIKDNEFRNKIYMGLINRGVNMKLFIDFFNEALEDFLSTAKSGRIEDLKKAYSGAIDKLGDAQNTYNQADAARKKESAGKSAACDTTGRMRGRMGGALAA